MVDVLVVAVAPDVRDADRVCRSRWVACGHYGSPEGTRPESVGCALAGPGSAHRPGRARIHRPASRRPGDDAAPQARARPYRPVADRLGERAATGALSAHVQPARRLPDEPARPGRVPGPKGAVRVLGARGVADPGGAAAVSALA